MRDKQGNNVYRIINIHKAALMRKPGYVEAVFAAAISRDAKTVTLTREAAAKISTEYGDGNPIIRRGIPRTPRVAGKRAGGCGACGKGRSAVKKAVADPAWHNAVNQTEGNE